LGGCGWEAAIYFYGLTLLPVFIVCIIGGLYRHTIKYPPFRFAAQIATNGLAAMLLVVVSEPPFTAYIPAMVVIYYRTRLTKQAR